jgi:predicted secreted Zn-dependent protease
MIARLLVAAAALLAAAPAAAQTVKADRFRAFLIWETTGDLSKNVMNDTPQIEANTQKGMSTQIYVDIVVTGPKD